MPSDPRRFAAVVIEFKDDDALAAFQRIQAEGLRVEITSTVIGQARELDELATSGDLAVHPKIYSLKLHPICTLHLRHDRNRTAAARTQGGAEVRMTVRTGDSQTAVHKEVTHRAEVRMPLPIEGWCWRAYIAESGRILESYALDGIVRNVIRQLTAQTRRPSGEPQEVELTVRFHMVLSEDPPDQLPSVPRGWLSEEVTDDGNCVQCLKPATGHSDDERGACRRAFEQAAAADDRTWD
jgi:hypothetical protein